MKFPLKLSGYTVRDAEDRVVISAWCPCDQNEKAFIVEAVNEYAARRGRVKVEDRSEK